MIIKSILLKFSILLSSLLFIYSCDQSKNKSKNSDNNEVIQTKKEQIFTELKIETLPSNQKEYKVGEIPKISLKQTDTLAFDSIQIYYGGEQLNTITELPIELELKRNNKRTGRADFEVRVFKNKASTSQKLSLKFLSDIEPIIYTYEVVRIYPHDKKAYTQGLLFENGFFYEATGLKGESSIRKVQLGTGEVIQSFTVSPEIFGEGITLFGDKLIQLSWQNHVGFIYDKKTFQLLAKFNYSTEGWGLTNDDKHLIMSDGSNKIYFLDTESYTEVKEIEVYDNKGPVNQLNELEYIDGEIYANIYQTNKIARIDPANGKVIAYIDLTGLLPKNDYDQDTDVLNGIAYDFNNKKLFVTGKRWPKLFEIKLKKSGPK